MADIKPLGTATNMAMADTTSVPTKSGTAPKAPELPTWSARIAVCGLHSRPKTNSQKGTARKKRRDSNSTEKTMATVVKMAIREQASSKYLKMRSTLTRARAWGA